MTWDISPDNNFSESKDPTAFALMEIAKTIHMLREYVDHVGLHQNNPTRDVASAISMLDIDCQSIGNSIEFAGTEIAKAIVEAATIIANRG